MNDKVETDNKRPREYPARIVREAFIIQLINVRKNLNEKFINDDRNNQKSWNHYRV
jgi:hypothetical protein